MDRGSAPWRVLDEVGDSATGTAGAPADDGPLARRPWLAAGVTAAAGALAVAAFVVAAGGARPSVDVAGALPLESGPGAASERAVSSPATSGGLLVVDVQGAVARPGVVQLVPGSRVGDAIAAAGGYGRRVAPERVAASLNLAALVRDGDQVVVPSRDDPSIPPGTAGGTPGSGTSGGGAAGASGPVDLNTATEAQLDALPGVGPVTVAKILAARDEQRFASVDDLRTRKLVGAATLDKIRSLVTVR
jgi:competence protein ComEA